MRTYTGHISAARTRTEAITTDAGSSSKESADTAGTQAAAALLQQAEPSIHADQAAHSMQQPLDCAAAEPAPALPEFKDELPTGKSDDSDDAFTVDSYADDFGDDSSGSDDGDNTADAGQSFEVHVLSPDEEDRHVAAENNAGTAQAPPAAQAAPAAAPRPAEQVAALNAALQDADSSNDTPDPDAENSGNVFDGAIMTEWGAGLDGGADALGEDDALLVGELDIDFADEAAGAHDVLVPIHEPLPGPDTVRHLLTLLMSC